MVIIDTHACTFSCGDRAFYRVAYLSSDPARVLRLCGHVHESRLSAMQCDEAREKASRLWTEEDFEREWLTL
ncbi:MAG: hypothetical protein KatS3mg005_4140 [Bryobacteraceae bacterium]|nr:MAG: hypothetical protein KatS3mg005_4140 [Bryobacteraceae bacterium]